MFNTPILFLVFNRLDTTKQVFAKIREIQPTQLFIGADGAREGKEGEKEKVDAVRKYILENIDWNCEVKTLFREKNLGCGVAPAEAITWFFDNVEQGIILEDDCLPDLSFFGFCEELLNYYKDEERVMHIAGSNFQNGLLIGKVNYFISQYPSGWGWASWASAWKKYDFYLKKMNEDVFNDICNFYEFDKKEIIFWREMFELVQNGRSLDIWDLQWSFTVFMNHGLSIHPQVNLVSNIGFGIDATHTIQIDSLLSNIQTNNIKVENFLPKNIVEITDKKAEKRTFEAFSPTEPFFSYIKNKIAFYMPKNIHKFLKLILLKK